MLPRKTFLKGSLHWGDQPTRGEGRMQEPRHLAAINPEVTGWYRADILGTEQAEVQTDAVMAGSLEPAC